jgi:uncharacterized protein YqcC (DUF446 family)
MSSSEKRLQIPFLPKAQEAMAQKEALPNVAPIKKQQGNLTTLKACT